MNNSIVKLVATNRTAQKFIDLDKIKFLTTENDTYLDIYEKKNYVVVKWIVFHDKTGNNSFIFEIHVSKSDLKEQKYRFRIEKFSKKV
jgi:hypothetical protein